MKNKWSIIRIITKRSFLKNKGRNIAAILAIILTTMMFTTLFTLAQSMTQNLNEMYLRQTGTKNHAGTKNITTEEMAIIATHPDVVYYGQSLVVGLAKNEELAGRQLEIRYADAQYAKDSFSYPTSGDMPKATNEIALDTLTLERLGIERELGKEVTLRFSVDESNNNSQIATFTLCGWWEGNHSVYASMAWVGEEFAKETTKDLEGDDAGKIGGLQMMGLTFFDTKKVEQKVEKVLNDCGLTHLQFNTNLAYTEEVQYMNFMESLPLYLGMIPVFFAGFLIIFNVFQISVASDIQFYGKLKTLGMTTHQIKKIVYGQANWLAPIGILVGLLIGYLLGVVLMPIFLASVGTKPRVSADLIIFLGSAIFAYITIIISCFLPARLAGAVSPMEALRYTDVDANDKVKIKKNLKKSKKELLLLGMAWENLWRNKKRTILVICSLTLGLVLMSFFYAKNESFDMEQYISNLSVADYQVDDATNKLYSGYDPESKTITEELLASIDAIGSIEASGRLYSKEIITVLSESTKNNLITFYTKARLDEFASYDASFPEWKKQFDQGVVGEPVSVTVYGADGLILEAATKDQYLLDGVYDAKAFATGDYVIAIGPAVDAQSNLPTYTLGERVSIENRDFTVMAVVTPLQPLVEGSSPAFELPMIMQADVFVQLWPEVNMRKFYFDVEEAQLDEAETLLVEYKNGKAPGMNIISRQTMIEQYKSQTRASAVMGYAISLLVALVGILNFINSMVTAIISRKREFAMLQSIGMSKPQLQKMIMLEGILYAALTLLVSYILGIFTVGYVVRAVVSGGYYSFQFTLTPLLLCTPLLLAFAILIPYLCFKNIEKKSLVERLRCSD